MDNLRTDRPYQAGHLARDTDANLGVAKDEKGNIIIIDLGGHRRGDFDKLGESENPESIKEGYYAQLGAEIKSLLNAMFGGVFVPVKIRGTQSEVSSFINALSKEKNYIENYMRNGLDNPQTYKSKSILDGAVARFERATGLKWPFK